MPNWCANRVDIYCDTEDDCNAIAALFAADKPFAAILPEPDWQAIPLEDGALPVVEERKLGDGSTYVDLRRPDGQQDCRWYDWRVRHWGTKWDIDSQEPEDAGSDSLHYEFDTAWGPPDGICAALRDRFPDASITWHWDEPGMQATGYL